MSVLNQAGALQVLHNGIGGGVAGITISVDQP